MTLLPPPQLVRPFDGMSSAGVLAAGGGPAVLRWAVKSAGPDVVAGLAIPFGVGDYIGRVFDAQTDVGELLGLPLLFEHGHDPAIKAIGEITDWAKLEEGIWIQGELAKRHDYIERIKRMLREGRLSFSSATSRLAAVAGADSERKASWPIQEISLTRQPANARAAVYRL
ncbi:MAG: hypothetical protein H0W81_02805 [Chloroflexi bacterium]|nr:hypothetical protein [Chloroflexota bacterium]